MRVTIRLFAGLAERMGGPSVILETEHDTLTAGILKDLLSQRYPEAAQAITASFVARNQAYARPEELIAEGDELALIPPVSGGSPSAEAEHTTEPDVPLFELTWEPLQPESISAKVMGPGMGANLTFTGTTREFTHGERTLLLEYEAYQPMALATLRQIGEEVSQRWAGARCAITHRLGPVALAEASVVIAVAAPHRAECYEASRYAIERLKQIVPIWKKEQREAEAEWKGAAVEAWDPTAVPASRPEGDAAL